jgi:hypothetical protein
VTLAERELHALREPLGLLPPERDPVDDQLDRVLPLPGERWRVLEPVDLPVDPGAHVAATAELLEQVAELALPVRDHRRQDQKPAPLRELQDRADDLVEATARHRLAAEVAVLRPRPRIEDAQVVVHLGDRADGRARVARRRLLLDGDRR